MGNKKRALHNIYIVIFIAIALAIAFFAYIIIHKKTTSTLKQELTDEELIQRMSASFENNRHSEEIDTLLKQLDEARARK